MTSEYDDQPRRESQSDVAASGDVPATAGGAESRGRPAQLDAETPEAPAQTDAPEGDAPESRGQPAQLDAETPEAPAQTDAPEGDAPESRGQPAQLETPDTGIREERHTVRVDTEPNRATGGSDGHLDRSGELQDADARTADVVADEPVDTPVTTRPPTEASSEGMSWRGLDDQLEDPQVHPDNQPIVDSDRDPLGGKSPQEFVRDWRRPGEEGGPDQWRWPDQSYVTGTREVVPVTDVALDRIGGEDGTYFSAADDPYEKRSLPPDRLAFPRTHWSVDPAAAEQAGVRLERSTVAPWFDQDGGGTQFRFLDADGRDLSVRELDSLKIIVSAEREEASR